ncbi:acetyltransferase [Aeromicrobium sp. PE09-221]|uniref:acetyltransferase n=1 Tax=Aeromicrobium sp. PE09-221 TaxID=1898043 RepID=UPI00191C8405|nr:acetyltransferase [Aeromicrobium sp. PE09-221]
MYPVLRPLRSADEPSVVEIWRRAVEATHEFLSPEDIDFYEGHIRDTYLPALDVTVAELSGRIVGFLGLQEHRVEMLFVDPEAHNLGIGTRLLAHAAARHARLDLDVNEQNPSALDFYRSRGFVETGRSPTDGEGRPFPLIHLSGPYPR